MLVIHGGKDYRVVESGGMATFTALQRRGIPSNSVFWHETVLGWLDQWTK